MIYNESYRIFIFKDIMKNHFYSFNRIVLCIGLVLTGMAQGMKRVETDKALLTPEQKRSKPAAVISPQSAGLRAENIARQIFEKLTKADEESGLADIKECTDKPEIALEALLDWYQRFPTIFSKIKWFIPEDKRDDAQADFKYKLAAALNQSILLCLSRSGSSDISLPVTTRDEGSSITSIQLGRFTISSRMRKEGLQAEHSITLVNKIAKMPTYNPDNRIKKAFMNYLFSSVNTDEFQNVLQELLSAIPASQRITKEQFYHALVYGMICFMGSNFSIVEAYSGEGRADLLLVSDVGRLSGSQNCIIEFKYNHSAQEALDQIEAQHYSKYFGKGRIVAVGINIKGSPFQVTCAKKILECPSPTITRSGETVSGTISWS